MASLWQRAEIPLVGRGLIGTKNVNEIPIDGLIDAESITFEDGTLRKEGGTTEYTTVGNDSLLLETGDFFLLESGDKLLLEGAFSSERILGGYDWNHDGATQRMVIVDTGGNIYKDSGSGDFTTTLKSSMTVTNDTVPVFVEAGQEAAALDRKLFIFTGSNQVQVLAADGATTGDLTTPATDWSSSYPSFGTNHAGRLWGGGNSNDPHRLYFSTTGDHEDFTGTGSGTLSIYPGEGETLVGAVSWSKDIIVAFKYPKGIYIIDTSDPAIVNWRVSRMSSKVGAAWIGAIANAQSDIIYMDAAGDIRSINTTDKSDDIGSSSVSDLSEMDEWIRENIDFTGRKLWRSMYYPTKKEVHFCLTGVGSTTVNNYRLVFDLNKTQLPRFRYSTRDKPCSMWIRTVSEKPVLMIGDDEFNVYNLDQETRSAVSDGYIGRFQTPHTDLGHIDPGLSTVRKNGHFLEAVIQPTGRWDLTCTVYWDGKIADTVVFNQGQSDGAELGSFTLGTSQLGSQKEIYSLIKRITGGGRRFSVVGKNSNAGEDFSLARLFLHYGVGDERFT